MQGVRHSKPDEVTKEIKSLLKEQVQPSDSSLAETIVAAGKQKLAKKPEVKQSALTGNL
jgi:type II secretory pathway component PulC